ncbi:hypothetical protein OPV22_017742 [Ensete ventricosum]|uniref:Uncharacterized protein n=1 Tax=Ensete ventricosum TaxID=4639 RepID=A0AAV8QYN5_ENSVE|nr:hypothetical protein OPV22_017742 [Ensete ventricosum]
MLSLAETFSAIVVSCSSYSAIPTGVLSQQVGGHRPYLRSQVLGSFRNSALNSGKGLRGPIEASMWLWNSCKTLSLHVDLQNWSCLITIFQKLHGHDSGLDVDSSKEKALFDSIYMQLSSGWVGCAVAGCHYQINSVAHFQSQTTSVSAFVHEYFKVKAIQTSMIILRGRNDTSARRRRFWGFQPPWQEIDYGGLRAERL